MAVMGSSTGGDKNTRLTGNHKSGKLDLGLEKKRLSPLERLTFMPYPCSHFYFDIKFGDRLYSKEKRPGSPLHF